MKQGSCVMHHWSNFIWNRCTHGVFISVIFCIMQIPINITLFYYILQVRINLEMSSKAISYVRFSFCFINLKKAGETLRLTCLRKWENMLAISVYSMITMTINFAKSAADNFASKLGQDGKTLIEIMSKLIIKMNGDSHHNYNGIYQHK